MKKAELINQMSKKSGLTKGQSEAALSALVDVMVDALKEGDKVSLKGFGTFSVNERKARTGRIIQTGEVIEIPARKVPTFKASTILKKSMNEE